MVAVRKKKKNLIWNVQRGQPRKKERGPNGLTMQIEITC